MPNINITFANELNVSLQAKPISGNTGWDTIYFLRTGETAPRYLGECVAKYPGSKMITVRVQGTIPTPVATDFIFFGKDTRIGTSGLDGYYARVEMKNTGTTAEEIFAVGSDVIESSK
tara:strand:- start:632 stop:985 length:354 start_codon:yes stop_codon:yes gene_type:complete